jgi:DNA-binding transcriptional MerR regulator
VTETRGGRRTTGRARGRAPAGGWRIGEVARTAGLSRQTIHQYVLLGLVQPSGQTAGGHRTFSSRVFRRLDEIRALKRTHTLAEIREVFARRQGTANRGRARRRDG